MPDPLPVHPELESRIYPAVLATAEAEWQRNVRDSSKDAASLTRIDQYIRTKDGLGWSWVPTYREDNFAWCGAFATFCYRSLGFHPKLALIYGSSTYRLDIFGKYQTFDGKKFKKVTVSAEAAALHPILSGNVGTFAIRDLHERCGALRQHQGVGSAGFSWTPVPGDIILVGEKNYGSHVTVCRAVEATKVLTWEGNAVGPGPDGTSREGVIRHERPLTKGSLHVLRVVRPSPIDFIPELVYA